MARSKKSRSVQVKVPRTCLPWPLNVEFLDGYPADATCEWLLVDTFSLVIHPSGDKVRLRSRPPWSQKTGDYCQYVYSCKSRAIMEIEDFYQREFKTTWTTGEMPWCLMLETTPTADPYRAAAADLHATPLGVVWLALRQTFPKANGDLAYALDSLVCLEDAPFHAYLERLDEIDYPFMTKHILSLWLRRYFGIDPFPELDPPRKAA